MKPNNLDNGLLKVLVVAMILLFVGLGVDLFEAGHFDGAEAAAPPAAAEAVVVASR